MIGKSVGPYQILAELGRGGMGEVYRARDSRLDRDVALKMLPEGLAADPDRLARFEREAKVLASLQHANIAAIHGIEESRAVRALVLELVEGPTLADRIAAGPIPVAEALAIARQIADALGYAHDAGVIHRDLKPANIKVKDDGTVKVLDFGLAKALERGPSQPEGPYGTGAPYDPTNSPTLTARATEIGIILGTAAYMAPEQARGKPVDRRADVWAFGVVLYEMLTGRRAFDGREISDVLAAVLKDTPSLAALPADVPAPVRRLLRRTLEKDRAKRLDSMFAARLELEDAAGSEPDAPGLKTRPPGWRAVAAGAIVVALVSAAAAGFSVWRAMRPAAQEVRRLTITPSADAAVALETNHNDVAITSDGRQIVYYSRLAQNQFVVRRLDGFEPVIHTKLGPDPRGPSLSPDGRWIVFQVGSPVGTDSQLTKVPIDGGSPASICSFDGNQRGASWGDNDVILFASTSNASGIQRVPAAGGTPEVVTRPATAEGEADHFWPQWLPDGRHALFTIFRADRTFDVAVLSLEAKTWRVLVKNATYARYAPTGHLVYASAGALRAVPFDVSRLEVRGEAVELVAGVLIKESGAADFAIAADGTLVYLAGAVRTTDRTLAWREPDGRETPVAVPAANYNDMWISPDERFAATVIGQAANSELWLIDLVREVSSRLTGPEYRAQNAVWSRDSQRIAFWSPGRAGTTEPGGVFLIAASGTSQPERLTTTPLGERHIPNSFTPDGKTLLFTASAPGAANIANIMQVTLEAPRTISPVLSGPDIEAQGVLSPDGQWLAYMQIETRPQIFIRPFPNVQAFRIPVTSESGQEPIWSRDGHSLYFRDRNLTALYAVDVKAAGDRVSVSAPRQVTPLRDEAANYVNVAVPPVGRRVLRSSRPVGPATAPEYRVILNWFEELKSRVTAKQ